MTEELTFSIFPDNIYKYISNRGDRRNGDLDDDFRYNIYSYAPFIRRNEFIRDKDRILFSRAFRRLEHKAQIYSHEKGDHFRTRLTHTLEVTQIAKSIARYLCLNEDLVEAITLGHDIGHTPFGHQGERVLDEILSGETELGGKLKYKINFGGFKHNFNSLKILDIIERKYDTSPGLNLTWQVLEGILKHTRTTRSSKTWDINRYIMHDCNNEEFNQKIIDSMKYPFSITLEGQIVAIADEVAQRQHDLDDGMMDINLELSIDDVYKEISRYIDDILEKSKPDKNNKLCLEQLQSLQERLNERAKSEDLRYKQNALTRDIIEYFICDITLASAYGIAKLGPEKQRGDANRKNFMELLVDFSDMGKEMNKNIERYIKYRILNSYEVNRFDGKAAYIIRQLFKAYYSNPRQMNTSDLRKLEIMTKDNSDIFEMEFINLEGKDGLNLKVKDISFDKSSPEEVNALISYLKMEKDIQQFDFPKDPEMSPYCYIDKTAIYLRKDKVNLINDYTVEGVVYVYN
jgi:dGTPase